MAAAESVVRMAQVVFTRVEPEYSPKARAGYQVVWASPSLAPEVVSEIESRVRCFVPTPGRGQRLQFAALQAGGYFVARSEQVEVNRRVCDHAGRSVFLAQAGWLDDEQLAGLDFNPFVVLDALPSIRRIEDLVDRFGQATGVASELDVDVGGSSHGSLSEESPERSMALALTGEILPMVHPCLTSGFFLRGGSGQIEAILRMVLSFLPPVRRHTCSFDTQIDGCFQRDTSYLLLSGHRPPPAVQLKIVDPAALAMPVIADEVCAVYVAWLARALSSQSVESVAEQAGTAYQVSLALCGRSTPMNFGLLNQDVCREIFEHETELLSSRIAAIRSCRFRRRVTEDEFERTLGEQVQTVPENIVAELTSNRGDRAWSPRRLLSKLWQSLRLGRRPPREDL